MIYLFVFLHGFKRLIMWTPEVIQIITVTVHNHKIVLNKAIMETV